MQRIDVVFDFLIVVFLSVVQNSSDVQTQSTFSDGNCRSYDASVFAIEIIQRNLFGIFHYRRRLRLIAPAIRLPTIGSAADNMADKKPPFCRILRFLPIAVLLKIKLRRFRLLRFSLAF